MPGAKIPEEQRRAQILEAAFRVAARAGLQHVTVRSVAHEAGVSVGLILFHFTTMDALHLALLDWLVARALVLDSPQWEAGSVRDEWLLGVVRQQLEGIRQERAEIELFIAYWLLAPQQSAIRAKIQAAVLRYRAALREAVAIWYQQAQPQVGALVPEHLALLIATVIEGYSLQAAHDPEATDPELLVAALRPLLAAARAVGPPT